MPKSLKPDSVVADCTKRLASRYYQLKTGHARTGQHLHWAKVRLTAQCWWCERPSQTRDQPLQGVPGMEAAAKGAVGRGAEGDGKVEELVEDTGPTCRQDAERQCWTSSPQRMWEGWCHLWKDSAGSQTSEWELRERPEREEEQEAEAKELGAAGGSGAGEELPLFLPTPSFMASADEE